MHAAAAATAWGRASLGIVNPGSPAAASVNGGWCGPMHIFLVIHNDCNGWRPVQK